MLEYHIFIFLRKLADEFILIIYKLSKLAKHSFSICIAKPRAPFPMATTPKGRRGRYSFPQIAPITLDPYLPMLIVV